MSPETIAHILRYWLGMIRHEEALGMRIRAAPPVPEGGGPPVNVLDPGTGQTYFKLRCGDPGRSADALLAQRERELTLEVTDDRCGFLEHFLRQTYRAQRFRRFNEDLDPMLVVVGFPVLYNARRGELSTLLRAPLRELVWQDEAGGPWAPPRPGKKMRRGRGVTPPPAKVRLRMEGPSADELPYAVNEMVLSRILGIQEELIGEFLEKSSNRTNMTAEGMIRSVTELLGRSGDEGDNTPMDLIRMLTQAVAARIGVSDVRVWPMGLAYDGTTMRATAALQQDLEEIVRSKAASASRGTPFLSYMTGRRLSPQRRVQLGRWRGLALTTTQRDVAQRFLGSRLTVAQGPPGTGKTALILTLCAQTLIERTACAGAGSPPRGVLAPMLVVASTNNRAVDNVVDPLCRHVAQERLPVALRLGSRLVVAEVTVTQLERCVRWLEQSTPSRSAYDQAMKRLHDALDPIQKAEDRLREAEHTLQAIEATEQERLELRRRLEEALEADPAQRLDTKLLRSARQGLKKTVAKLATPLADRVSRRTASPKEATRCYRALVRAVNSQLLKRLEPLKIKFDLPEPLPESTACEAWAALFEDATDRLDELENVLDDLTEQAELQNDRKALRERLEAVEQRLAALIEAREEPALLAAALQQEVASCDGGLLDAAIEAREAWASLNREGLLKSLCTAIDTLKSAPSLEALRREDPEAHQDLLRLFPVFGCTLLSVRSAFQLSPEVIDRLVVDEAGQCHPAHLAPALLRAKRALIIGDVHQLEPVIDLTHQEEARVLRRLGLPVDLDTLGPYRVHRAAHNSAQALAARAVREVPSLRDHFRCQGEIIAISNRLCDYDLTLRTTPASLSHCCPLLHSAVVGIGVWGTQSPYVGSWRNDEEIACVLNTVQTLLAAGVSPDQIAVVTPYRGQVRALASSLRAAHVPIEEPEQRAARDAETQLFQEPPRRVVLGTLHRFQGGERDVVVLSTVVSAPRSLEFTNRRVNLVNVAVSRARMHLLVIGNPDVLEKGRFTQELVRAARFAA